MRAGRGAGLARSRRGPGASLGSRLAVRSQRVPQETQSARHHGLDETRGDCCDNAPMESVNVTLKVEPLANWPRPQRHQAQALEDSVDDLPETSSAGDEGKFGQASGGKLPPLVAQH